MTRHAIGSLSNYEENKPAKVSAGGRDLVLVRQADEVFVLDHECPHLGAPLSDALVHEGSLVCPWHRAVFRLNDGQYLEPPACDNLRRYEAVVVDGEVHVEIDESSDTHPLPPHGVRDPGDGRHFVVIGSGGAGLMAVQTLREAGYGGGLTLVSEEEAAPYERTPLSKSITESPDGPNLRDKAWFDEVGVHTALGRKVTKVSGTKVHFEDGEVIDADRVILATGAEPVTPDLPGRDLDNVHVLRSLKDALALTEAVKAGTKLAIVGSGFIGLEAAATFKDHVASVTVLALDDVPFAGLLGERVGKVLKDMQVRNGIDYRGGVKVTAIEGEAGRAARVVTEDTKIDADIVLLATGVRPRTGLLEGVDLDDDGGVPVTDRLEVEGQDGLYAAGDIARVGTLWGPMRTEHWRFAQQTGRLAALNAAGASEVYRGTPFFWSAQFAGGSYVYVGHAEAWDEIRYEGDVESGENFIAWYVKGGKILAAFGHGHADRLSRLERVMDGQGPVSADDWI